MNNVWAQSREPGLIFNELGSIRPTKSLFWITSCSRHWTFPDFLSPLITAPEMRSPPCLQDSSWARQLMRFVSLSIIVKLRPKSSITSKLDNVCHVKLNWSFKLKYWTLRGFFLSKYWIELDIIRSEICLYDSSTGREAGNITVILAKMLGTAHSSGSRRVSRDNKEHTLSLVRDAQEQTSCQKCGGSTIPLT